MTTFQGEDQTKALDERQAVLQRNKTLVIEHFRAFVNDKDLAAIDRNMFPDFVDHDGPGDKPVGRDGDRVMMSAMHEQMPDLTVEVRDALAEDDKVVVRNVWTWTDPATGERREFRGFVMWRIANGKIAERWATVTPMRPVAAAGAAW